MQGQESRSYQSSTRPDYNEFTDGELKALVTSYGYKTRTTRLQKMDYLERLYDGRITECSSSSLINDPEEDLIDPESIRQKIRDHIKADPALWTQIVSYKAVNVDQLQKDLDFACSKDEVRAILDEFAIFEKATNKSNKKGKKK